MAAQRDAYPVPEAAHRLGVSASTVWREIKAGALRPSRVRGRVLVPAAEIARYLDRQRVTRPVALKERRARKSAAPLNGWEPVFPELAQS